VLSADADQASDACPDEAEAQDEQNPSPDQLVPSAERPLGRPTATVPFPGALTLPTAEEPDCESEGDQADADEHPVSLADAEAERRPARVRQLGTATTSENDQEEDNGHEEDVADRKPLRCIDRSEHKNGNP
jgi:hypothetical protein